MSEQGWLTIITAILAALPVTIAAIMANQKLKALHIDVNSRLTEMLKLAKTEGLASGELKGRYDSKREAKGGYLANIVVPPADGKK